MSVILDSNPELFNLDAILQEFNVGNISEPSTIAKDDSAVSRVRESLGLGRSLFRRKENQDQNEETIPTDNDKAKESPVIDDDVDGIENEKSLKPRKRIVDSDNDEDENLAPTKPIRRPTPAPSVMNDYSNDRQDPPEDNNDTGSDDDPFTAENFLADYR